MTPGRVAAALFMVALGAGTLADRPRVNPVVTVEGYRVLAVDFHTHSSTWSDGSMTPFGLVLEAQRQGLDAIAITGHNQVGDSKAGRWFSQLIDGPTVLTGQEIIAPGRHVIAVGIESLVDWRLNVAGYADAVHRQGGVAIAAHPVRSFWPAFDEAAVSKLDGAEICHPLIYNEEGGVEALEAFARRGKVAAIGSSDTHGPGPMGLCRTYVFASDNTPQAIVEAVRAHRTVVYGFGGKAYGDPAFISHAESHRLREAGLIPIPRGVADVISQVGGLAGLLGLVLFMFRR